MICSCTLPLTGAFYVGLLDGLLDGLLGLLIVRQWIIPKKSLRLAPVSPVASPKSRGTRALDH